jgi:hypothetical protein
MTSLNLANNNLGELLLPKCWTKSSVYDNGPRHYKHHTDGRVQEEDPSRPFGSIAIANAIPDMGAISSVNLLKNDIGVEQAGALVSILKEHPTLKSLCGNSGKEAELDMSGKMKGADDAIMLAAEIVNNRALSSLNLFSCGLTRGALKIDRRGSYAEQYGDKWGSKDEHYESHMQGIIAIATAIPDMGTILQLTFAGDGKDSKPVTMETSMVEADFSGKGLGVSGAIMAGAFLPKCT